MNLYRLISALLLLALSAGAEPRRIVSTFPSITETLFALGAGDRVVGVSDFCRYPAAALALPKIGSYTRPDPEKIALLHPDLVIIQDWMSALDERLSSLQIPTLKLKVGSLPEIYSMIDQMGVAIGSPGQARRLNAGIRSQLAQISVKTHPTVLMIIGRNPGALTNLIAVGPSAYLGQLLNIAGGQNVLSNTHIDYPHIALESVIRLNPDIILDLSMMGDAPQEKRLKESWLKRGDLTAVQTGRVFGMTNPALVTPGPRVVEAAQLLRAKMVP